MSPQDLKDLAPGSRPLPSPFPLLLKPPLSPPLPFPDLSASACSSPAHTVSPGPPTRDPSHLGPELYLEPPPSSATFNSTQEFHLLHSM